MHGINSSPTSHLPPTPQDDDEEAFSPDTDDEEEDDDEEEAFVAKPSRRKRAKVEAPSSSPSSTPPPLSKPVEVLGGVLTIENAKTGRSKCRKCMEPIAAGELRIGMQAWIMGRQAVTWQHPCCFMGNLTVAVEATGRGKCKGTGLPLTKGEPKLGMRSHTNTSWLSLGCAAEVLAPVVNAAPAADADAMRVALGGDGASPQLEGLDGLGPAHADAVCAVMRQVGAAGRAEGASGVSDDDSKTDSAASDDDAGDAKPKTGKVAWKWGSQLCYGKLLPKQETKTHCYARTHKGNTKTLAKGKDYWWCVKGE